MKFRIRKFEDKPKYCRVPIYFGGERQIHIMQPFDKKKNDVGPEPHNSKEWFRISQESGQVVFSLESVEDFIEALQQFKSLLKTIEKVEA